MNAEDIERRRQDAVDAMPLVSKMARWLDVWALPLSVWVGAMCILTLLAALWLKALGS